MIQQYNYRTGKWLGTTYSGNKTTVTDEAGKTKTYTYDGLGRLTSVAERPTLVRYASFLDYF